MEIAFHTSIHWVARLLWSLNHNNLTTQCISYIIILYNKGLMCKLFPLPGVWPAGRLANRPCPLPLARLAGCHPCTNSYTGPLIYIDIYTLTGQIIMLSEIIIIWPLSVHDLQLQAILTYAGNILASFSISSLFYDYYQPHLTKISALL